MDVISGKTDRSFRNSSIFLRIIASVIFIPCFVIITMRGGYHFLALIDTIIFTGTLEFYRLMEQKGIKPYKGIGIICALALSWYVYFKSGVYANFFLTLMLVTLMSLELTRKDSRMAIYHISTTILGMIYVSYLASHFILLREFPRSLDLDYSLGSSLVFLVVVVTWAGDTGAYFVGMAFGKHSLLPRVSEKKTKEGSAGGLIFSIMAAFVAKGTFAPYLENWHALALGIIAGIVGQLGDLVESMIKRDAELKDASSTIPGHGGVLDRFDSLLFTTPLFYYFLKFVVFK